MSSVIQDDSCRVGNGIGFPDTRTDFRSPDPSIGLNRVASIDNRKPLAIGTTFSFESDRTAGLPGALHRDPFVIDTRAHEDPLASDGRVNGLLDSPKWQSRCPGVSITPCTRDVVVGTA